MSSKKNYESNDTALAYGEENAFGDANAPQMQRKSRPVAGRKRGKAPSSFNGMHRRRRRKMSW